MHPEDSTKPSVTDATSSSPASVSELAPAGLHDSMPGLSPLPPKWSEVHAASPIRAFPPQPDLDAAIQGVAAKHCQAHVMVTSVLGGEPLTVSRCMGCGTVDWEDLRAQADAYARQYACRLLEEQYGYFEYPDSSRRIAWEDGKPQRVNIQQVYNLFSKDVRDGCSTEPPVIRPMSGFPDGSGRDPVTGRPL